MRKFLAEWWSFVIFFSFLLVWKLVSAFFQAEGREVANADWLGGGAAMFVTGLLLFLYIFVLAEKKDKSKKKK
jgi:uncharacterized membrane protein